MKIRAFLLAVVGSTILCAAPAHALVCVACHLPKTHTWPRDPAPCDAGSTLQACIDSANPGDTVQIATNGPIDESPSITGSLTLTATPGSAPVFSPGQSIRAITPTSGSSSLTVEGLTLEDGELTVVQESTDPLTVEVRNNTIATSSSFDPAIRLIGNGSGTVTFDLSGNDVSVPVSSNGSYPTGILVGSENVTGRIAGNTIAMGGGPLGYAISIGASSSSLDVDVIGNRISGSSYADGISVAQEVVGTTEVRILDNLVTGADQMYGRGVDVNASSGTLHAMIANNTLADDAIGIQVSGRPDLGAVLSAEVANNVITGCSYSGFIVPSDERASVSDQNNLYFANAYDLGTSEETFPPGPNSVFSDPLFVGSGDYHLKPGSPAIDAGDDGSVPADLTTDLDGSPRIQGSHVDIGAYEAAPEPDAQMLAATAVAALLGVVARHAARRAAAPEAAFPRCVAPR